MGAGRLVLARACRRSYLITTDDGRIVVNTGMWFEARTHKRNYDAVTTAPTRYIVLTQSHTDHIGGVDTFREDGTAAHRAGEHRRVPGRRRAHPRPADPPLAAVLRRRDGPARLRARRRRRASRRSPKPAEPDITFDDTLRVRRAAAVASSCISVPGGETIDSLVVWLPDDGVALVGNMFSALFGHFPNLVTMRGDRMRNALAFVESVQRVIDLEPEMLLLGHHGPVRGAATVRVGVRTHPRRDAVRARRDGRRDERRPRRVDRDARRSRCPSDLELGEAYGRVDWSVRAIWETYAGWFHQHSTLELYGAAPEQGAAEIVALAGGADAVAARAAALVADRSARRGAAVRARARRRRRARGRARRVPRARTSSCSPSTAARTSGSPAGSKARFAARRTGSSGSDPST